jgi:hypothetical protein
MYILFYSRVYAIHSMKEGVWENIDDIVGNRSRLRQNSSLKIVSGQPVLMEPALRGSQFTRFHAYRGEVRIKEVDQFSIDQQ